MGGKQKKIGSLLNSSALWGAGIVLGLMLSAGAVRAEDTLTFNIGAGIRHDDNIFRLPSSADAQTVLGTPKKSDSIQTTTFGLKLDKTYSQQRFLAMAGITDNRYQNYSHLSFVSKNYQAEWQWYLTSRLTGRLAADRLEALNDFRDYQGYSTRNIRTTENRRFVADWWLQGSWHLIGGVVEGRQTNSQDRLANGLAFADASSRVRSGEAGVKYLTESGNFLTLLSRKGRGEYPGREANQVALLDNRFDQDEIELGVSYQLTGKSTLNGRLARLERQHDHFPVRDYSGTVGRLDYVWIPVANLDINFAAARDLISFQIPQPTSGFSSSYYINDRLSVAPSWHLSALTTVGAMYEQGWRDYRGAVPPSVDSRSDQTRTLGLTFGWTPNRTVSVTGSVAREKLTSNFANVGYTATMVSLAVQATF